MFTKVPGYCHHINALIAIMLYYITVIILYLPKKKLLIKILKGKTISL